MTDNDGIIKGTTLVKDAEGRPGSSAVDRQTYASTLIDSLRKGEYTLTAGRLTVVCAKAFGFCWGVDKAVDIVQQTMATYPGKRIWILNQIIHNPAVNRDFIRRGARFIKGSYSDGDGFASLTKDDVAIIPAFSAEVGDIERLKTIGCTIIDTTCPWVLKPHLRTKRNIEADYTTVIHATLGHDETNATCSLIEHEKGKYLVVRGIDEARILCNFIEGKVDASTLRRVLEHGMSPGFDPDEDLRRIALINQTTMLASESREIGQMIQTSIRKRGGESEVRDLFRDFDTICNATQENQDAMVAMIEEERVDLVIVVGGYNSSNTKNLARIAHLGGVPTYHIEDAASLDPQSIRYQPIDEDRVVTQEDWLPAGEIRVGFTAGASTPDTKLAAAMERLAELAGVQLGGL